MRRAGLMLVALALLGAGLHLALLYALDVAGIASRVLSPSPEALPAALLALVFLALRFAVLALAPGALLAGLVLVIAGRPAHLS